MATRDGQPFRFLDLPKELRLMVYEQLPVTKYHRVLEDPLHHYMYPSAETHPSAAHIFGAPPLAILRTCQSVYKEAPSILMSTLNGEPLRIVIDALSLDSMLAIGYFNIVEEISKMEQRLLEGGDMDIPESYIQSTQNHNAAGQLEMIKTTTGYARVHRSLLQCAEWKIQTSRHAAAQSIDEVCIGIRVPANSTVNDMLSFFTFAINTIISFRAAKTPRRVCVVVQPSHPKIPRGFDLREKIQDVIDLTSNPSNVERRGGAFRVVQPSEAEWAREWEECS